MITLDTQAHNSVIQQCFNFKGTVLTATVIQLLEDNPASFIQQLSKLTKTHASLLQQAPVLIDLEKFKYDKSPDFHFLMRGLKEYGLIPLAVRGGDIKHREKAQEAGLPVIPLNKFETDKDIKQVEHTTNEHKDAIKSAVVGITGLNNSTSSLDRGFKTRVIDAPVRSGQQIYARQADLIIKSAVSAGAEIMADGHIHVYGSLRGRALAGVSGDKEARIFCRELDAELLSVAGFYKVKEDIQVPKGQAYQIYLDKERLMIEAF